MASSNVAKIVMIVCQVLYRLATPYSSVVKSLVKNGVVINDIPLVTTLENINHIAAFAGKDMFLYLSNNLLTKLIFLDNFSSHILYKVYQGQIL